MMNLLFIFIMIGAVATIAEVLYTDAVALSESSKKEFKKTSLFFAKLIIILGLSIKIYLELENI